MGLIPGVRELRLTCLEAKKTKQKQYCNKFNKDYKNDPTKNMQTVQNKMCAFNDNNHNKKGNHLWVFLKLQALKLQSSKFFECAPIE